MLTDVEYTNWIVKIGQHEHKFLDKSAAENFYESLKDYKLTKILLLRRETKQTLLRENELVSADS